MARKDNPLERGAPRKSSRPKSGRDVRASGEVSDVPRGLTPGEYDFCLTYLTNGYNATAAYRATHPDCKTDGSARTLGWRMLTKVDVRAFLREQLGDRWKAHAMDAEEASARVAMDARSDLRGLYDDKGNILPVPEWPDEIANSVEGIEFDEDGGVKKVKLVSKGSARRLILELTGKLKAPGDGMRDLAEILAEKFKEVGDRGDTHHATARGDVELPARRTGGGQPRRRAR